MKKRLLPFSLSALISLVIGLSGCGTGSGAANEETVNKDVKTMSGASTTGPALESSGAGGDAGAPSQAAAGPGD